MENKINIVELLKDCPSGMELDCTLFDDVHFDSVDEVCDIIKCYIKDSHHKIGISFDKYGHYSNIRKAKCVIFPKGKTTWEGFVPPCKFKDGDIVVIKTSHNFIFYSIYQGIENREVLTYVDYYLGSNKLMFNTTFHFLCFTDEIVEQRLATEEEKQKIFQAIKDNGYKWNAETKTLEKLVKPKFKVGDVIQDIDTYKVKITEVSIEDECYEYESMDIKGIGSIGFSEQDNWELAPNKFDITTLKPFDKVLVRNTNKDYWRINMFGYISKGDKQYFMCTANSGFYQCIPYEGNEHLLGTTDDCDDFYKTW